MSHSLRLTVPEILSLLGLTQCVYILVYMTFRAGDWRAALLPFCYFFALGLAFFIDFAGNYLGPAFHFYPLAAWAAWFVGPPLAVLLTGQIAGIGRPGGWRIAGVIAPVPLAGLLAFFASKASLTCRASVWDCPVFAQWLVILGLGADLIAIAALWPYRAALQNHKTDAAGRDRYWLILTLIFVNLLFLAMMLLALTPLLSAEAASPLRTLLGLTLVYLAGSSLFRIYPQAIPMVERKKAAAITPAEQDIARRIEDLLTLDKIYQEAAYTRADLARELNLPEAAISRIINAHFKKTFPQLLNERRVADARRLLSDSTLPVKDIAEQVGFNSMASFNRVFRDLTGMSPSGFRDQISEVRNQKSE